jgi:hypothetical protein
MSWTFRESLPHDHRGPASSRRTELPSRTPATSAAGHSPLTVPRPPSLSALCPVAGHPRREIHGTRPERRGCTRSPWHDIADRRPGIRGRSRARPSPPLRSWPAFPQTSWASRRNTAGWSRCVRQAWLSTSPMMPCWAASPPGDPVLFQGGGAGPDPPARAERCVGHATARRSAPGPGHRPRSRCRLRQASSAPPTAGTTMNAIAIRNAGEVGVAARAPATT